MAVFLSDIALLVERFDLFSKGFACSETFIFGNVFKAYLFSVNQILKIKPNERSVAL